MSLAGFAAKVGVAWWANKQLEEQVAEQHERAAERERAAAEARRMEAERERLAAVQERQARAVEEARRQERARLSHEFAEQYEAPADCANPPSERRFVECVDHRRNAQALFMQEQTQ